MSSNFWKLDPQSIFELSETRNEQVKTDNYLHVMLFSRRYSLNQITGNYVGNRYVGWKETNFKAPIREKISMKFLYYDLKHCGMLRGLCAGQ
jgi:hypothetical protein